MRLLKAGLVQLLLVSVLGLVSAAPALALELPDLHTLSGVGYPAEFAGTLEGAEVFVIEDELGEKLTASAVTIEAELLELSALGPIVLIQHGFVEVKSKTKCHTIGDPEGTVKLAGEWHLVDIFETPLTAALLVVLKETTLECNSGKLKIKTRGPVILKLEKVTSGTDVEKLGAVAKCTGKGKQELREYLNEIGVPTHATPSANFGLGFTSTCVNIKGELLGTSTKLLNFLF